MKHFRTAELDDEQRALRTAVNQFDCSEVEEQEHAPGELDGNGRCMDCGTNWIAAVGVYWCPFCSEDF